MRGRCGVLLLLTASFFGQPPTIPPELSEAVSKRSETGLRRFLGLRKGACAGGWLVFRALTLWLDTGTLMATADGEERYSPLGLCIKSNFAAGVKLCLAEHKHLLEAVCAELPGERERTVCCVRRARHWLTDLSCDRQVWRPTADWIHAAGTRN